MATLSSTTLTSTNAAAADFRAWSKFIADVFALAWTTTADTGQIDFTTVAAPGAINTSMGYKMFAMADALQSTKPVFVKVEFGSGGTAAAPAIWLTIGTSTNGTGTVGGTILLARLQLNGNNTTTTVFAKNYGSADTARVTIAIFLDQSSVAPIALGIERTKDANGADTNLGIIFAYVTQGAGLKKSYYLPFIGTLPVPTNGFHIVLAETTPSSLSGNVGVSPVIPMGYDAKQPGMNFIVCLVNDFTDFANFQISMYAANRTFQHLGSFLISVRAAGTLGVGDTNTRLCIRYE
jgi:hypothetical protein